MKNKNIVKLDFNLQCARLLSFTTQAKQFKLKILQRCNPKNTGMRYYKLVMHDFERILQIRLNTTMQPMRENAIFETWSHMRQ